MPNSPPATPLAMQFAGPRGEQNRLAREHSCFCSALVRHVYREAGVDFLLGPDVKHATPEEPAGSPRRRARAIRTLTEAK